MKQVQSDKDSVECHDQPHDKPFEVPKLTKAPGEPNNMYDQFENLIFEGGGVKGVAYIGAMDELHDIGILKNIKRVAGTSAGAINALLFALQYSIKEQTQILNELDISKFEDTLLPVPITDVTKGKFFESWARPLTVILALCRLWAKKGLHSGSEFEIWIGKMISGKFSSADVTFAELKKRGGPDLYIVGSNISNRSITVFSAETTPEMSVKKAVRISMSIPVFFEPVVAEINGTKCTFVDGGLFKNFAITLFDDHKYISKEQQIGYRDENSKMATIMRKTTNANRPIFNKGTLGFRLDSRAEIQVFRDGGENCIQATATPIEYIKAVLGAAMYLQENQHLESEDWRRTVYIDTLGVGTIDFAISPELKAALAESGRRGVQEYLAWWANDKESETPAGLPIM